MIGQAKLLKYQPCIGAVRYVREQKTQQQAWDNCRRGDWLLWIAGRAELCTREQLVAAACECARIALPFTTDPRVLSCIETVEAWARGAATLEQVMIARAAAYAAADAAADAAANAAANAAAYAAANAAAYAAAHSSTLKQCADIVRRRAKAEGWRISL